MSDSDSDSDIIYPEGIRARDREYATHPGFPEGDILLISNNDNSGYALWFTKAELAAVSPVFRDMFNNASVSGTEIELDVQGNPLLLFLSAVRTPHMLHQNVAWMRVMEAIALAKKYECDPAVARHILYSASLTDPLDRRFDAFVAACELDHPLAACRLLLHAKSGEGVNATGRSLRPAMFSADEVPQLSHLWLWALTRAVHVIEQRHGTEGEWAPTQELYWRAVAGEFVLHLTTGCDPRARDAQCEMSPNIPTVSTDRDPPLPFAQITPSLYLGSYAAASSLLPLTRLGITHIVNVAEGCPNLFPDRFRYLTIPCRDRSHEVLSPYFAEVAAFVDVAEKGGGEVLIHCRFGISRSVTFVIATLVLNGGMSTEEALAKVKRVNGEAEPNEGFMRQLRRLDGTTTEEDERSEGDALDRTVRLHSSVYAVDYLREPELLNIRKQAILALEAIPVADRVDRLLRLWLTVCENYASRCGADERARRSFGGLLLGAIEGGLVRQEETLEGLGKLKEGEEWWELKLDVPMADGFMEAMRLHLSAAQTRDMDN